MNCTSIVLQQFLLILLNVLITFGQTSETDDEDDDYRDYGDEKLLWGKELSPQWCESPVINSTLGDQITFQSSFIDPNSKGQYATETVAEVNCGAERWLKLTQGVIHPLRNVYLRCTLNSTGTGGVWSVIHSGGTVIEDSVKPICVHEAPTFHLCELPHLVHRGLRLTLLKKSRYFMDNDTLDIKCATTAGILHPPGRHTLRCSNSHWIHEVDNTPTGFNFPTCVARSVCTISQLPDFLRFTINDIICQKDPTQCPSLNTPLSLGTKVELRCKDEALRLVGPSSVICLNSELQTGSAWYPPKWPNCVTKLTCSEPFIQKSTMVTSEKSNGTFRWGGRVWFECWEGYKLHGSKVVECLKSGLWNDSLPICIEDETEFNEDSAAALLLALIIWLLFILAIMCRAVYRQNRRLNGKQCRLFRTVVWHDTFPEDILLGYD